MTNLVPCFVVAFGVVYSDKIHTYTYCLGREETFVADLDNLLEDGVTFWSYGRYINQPLYHPYRLISNLVYFSYILVVPVAYVAIYRFRSKHDKEVPGSYNFWELL